MTYREAIVSGEKSLCEAGIADARNDAWLLLTMACKIDHTYYYMHIDEEMPEELQHEFEVLIKKRAERVPLQYITGEQEFMGMTFHVNSNVLISIVFFLFIRVDSRILQLVLRLLLIPVIAGVSYEFIRLAGRYDNRLVNILSKPGLWMQKMTTKEPDDEMIEVGIASVEAVFDWRKWQKEEDV